LDSSFRDDDAPRSVLRTNRAVRVGKFWRQSTRHKLATEPNRSKKRNEGNRGLRRIVVCGEFNLTPLFCFCPGKASEHDTDHGQPDEGSDGAGVALEIARQAAIAADPRQGTFDDPAPGQDDEFVQFITLDDLKHPTTGLAAARAARGP
jgi:hypothetical protein